MATQRDYYEVLGLERNASSRDVKRAYRQLAVRYHPDRNPGDKEAEELFKEAAEAYAVLSDAEKRSRYDRFGHRGVGAGGFGGFDPETFGDFADILGDFFGFSDLFGGSRRRRDAPRPGADLRYELEIGLEEAAFGCERSLEVPRLETCGTCSGSGSADGQVAQCQACGGSGQLRMTQGFFTVARTCPQCRGEGRVVTRPCKSCGGEGRRTETRKIEVKIPPGVDTGTRLRLRGEGEHGRRNGPSGDLYVDVIVTPHPKFERHGDNVVSALELSYPEAVLGTRATVETLWGEEELDVPPGTAHGTQFTLRGKGVQRLGRASRGDHLVIAAIDVPHPRDLAPEEIERVRELAELAGKNVKGERRVLDKVRDLFA